MSVQDSICTINTIHVHDYMARLAFAQHSYWQIAHRFRRPCSKSVRAAAITRPKIRVVPIPAVNPLPGGHILTVSGTQMRPAPETSSLIQ